MTSDSGNTTPMDTRIFLKKKGQTKLITLRDCNDQRVLAAKVRSNLVKHRAGWAHRGAIRPNEHVPQRRVHESVLSQFQVKAERARRLLLLLLLLKVSQTCRVPRLQTVQLQGHSRVAPEQLTHVRRHPRPGGKTQKKKGEAWACHTNISWSRPT